MRELLNLFKAFAINWAILIVFIYICFALTVETANLCIWPEGIRRHFIFGVIITIWPAARITARWERENEGK